MLNLLPENIDDWSNYLLRLAPQAFLPPFQPVAHRYQAELRSAVDAYQLAMSIRLSGQLGPSAIQRNRFANLARKIQLMMPLIQAD